MFLKGYVYDNQTGNGIPYASVTITDSNGNTFNKGTAADQYGYFELTNDLLDTVGWLLVSSAGYKTILVNPGVFQESGDIGLDESDTLPVATVTYKIKKEDWPLYVLGGGTLALLFKKADERKRITGLDPKQTSEWLDLALKIGIPVVLFFVIVKPLLVKLGLLPDPTEKAQTQSDKDAAAAQGKLNTWNNGDNHTYNQATLDSVAVALRNTTANWYQYKWGDIPALLAYIPGMTTADGIYFLGTFVDKNGETLWTWYKAKFQDSVIIQSFDWGNVVFTAGWGATGSSYDYSGSFNRVGINEDNASTFDWEQVMGKFVSYVYDLTKIAKQ